MTKVLILTFYHRLNLPQHYHMPNARPMPRTLWCSFHICKIGEIVLFSIYQNLTLNLDNGKSDKGGHEWK